MMNTITIGDLYSNQELKDIGIGWFSQVKSLRLDELQDKQFIYGVQTPYHNYNGFQGGTRRAYIWNAELQRIELLFSNLSKHRASVALAHYQDYLDGKIDDDVWQNYITGGYTTRFKGLLGNYGESQIKRIQCMSRSHAEYMPTGDSTHDHNMRVSLRNRYEH